MSNEEPLRYIITAKGSSPFNHLEYEQKFAQIKKIIEHYSEIKIIQQLDKLYSIVATSTKEDFEKLFEVILKYEREYPDSPSKLAQQIMNWKIQGEKSKFRVPKDKIPKDLEEIAVVEIDRKEFLGGRR